jgi:hypothetical protein
MPTHERFANGSRLKAGMTGEWVATATGRQRRAKAYYFTRVRAAFASMCSMVVLAPVAAAAAK